MDRYGVIDATIERLRGLEVENGELRRELMGERNTYHPTGDARADGIKAKVEELVGYIKRETDASGPLTKRAAALAVTNLEQGGMWAVRALTAEDAVRGDEPMDP